MLSDDQKKIRLLKRHLSGLVCVVEAYIKAVDDVMEELDDLGIEIPDKQCEQLVTFSVLLEIAKDKVKHFGLGKSSRTLSRKRKQK